MLPIINMEKLKINVFVSYVVHQIQNQMNTGYYKNKLPQTNDIVMGKIIQETEYNYNVELIEYNNYIGELPKTQITKKKRPQKKDLVQVGDIVPLLVSNVTDVYVELSKSRLPVKDVDPFVIKFGIYSNLDRLATEYYYLYYNYYKQNKPEDLLDITDFMKLTMWKFYDETESGIETFFAILLKNPLVILSDDHFAEEFRTTLNDNINNRIKRIEPVIKQQMKLVVSSSEGINAIKDILDLDKLYDDIKIIVNIETPPVYSIQTEGMNLNDAKNIIDKIIDDIKIKTQKYNGIFEINGNPIIIKEEKIDLKFMSDNVLNQLIK